MLKNQFNSIQTEAPRGNMFDLTHVVKMTGKFGELMPVLAMECLPGDKHTLGTDQLIRMAPTLAPVFEHFDTYVHFFFVPNRIVWPKEGINGGWEQFITDPDSGVPFPYISNDGTSIARNRFMDYFGIPIPYTGAFMDVNLSAIPFAGYQAIYNEYYRDQDLIAEVDYKLIDGDNAANLGVLTTMRKRAFGHDRFTSARPFAQKGQPVVIPAGNVISDVEVFYDPLALPAPDTVLTGTTVSPTVSGKVPDVTIGAGKMFADTGGLEIGSITVEAFRTALRAQEHIELLARAGNRLTEVIRAHFDVTSSDSRLQRPEYITGTKAPIIVSEVLNTTGDIGAIGSPQGNMSGHGVSVGQGRIGSFFCEEHGYIIGIMSIMPKPIHASGIPKHFRKFDIYDHYWPKLNHLGEQPIKNWEVKAWTNSTIRDEDFGYAPQYSEYTWLPSRVAGDFRTSLAYWHAGNLFNVAPNSSQDLNQQYIEVDPDSEANTRIFAVQDGTDYFWIQLLILIKSFRKMPFYNTPRI